MGPSAWNTLLAATALASLLGGVLASPGLRPAITRRQSPSNDTVDPPPVEAFDWDSISASADLAWVDCYTPPFKCARLSVPLNYSDPSTDALASVALISHPSPLANTSSDYRGPILVNPGGPGGSGVEFVLGASEYLRGVFGDEFDFVGFDPRGVGETTPKLNYTTDPVEQLAFGKRFLELVDLSEDTWPTLPQRIEELAENARESGVMRGEVLRHASTENVARDMMRIVEAHGEERLQYYGISYGSVLGSVFATLFPDNVERIIIDGVVDQVGYFADDWSGAFVDTEKVFQWFISSCVSAGPELCLFHSNTTDALLSRYEAIEDLVRSGSLFYPDAPTRPVQLAHVQLLAFNIMYSVSGFPALAEALVALENGVVPFSAEMLDTVGWALSMTGGLACSDTKLAQRTEKEMREYALNVRNVTEHLTALPSFSGAWCSGWQIESDNFKGPMGANTSVPLLMVGNTADTITPLIAAQENSARFPGSRVLTYDAPGHATLAFPGNECIAAHFRAYMLNGTLPEEGAVCEETRPFFTAAANVTGEEVVQAVVKRSVL